MQCKRKLNELGCELNLAIASALLQRQELRHRNAPSVDHENPVRSANQYLSMMIWMSETSHEKLSVIIANLLQQLERCSINEYVSICETIEIRLKSSLLKVLSDDFYRQLRRLSILFDFTTKFSLDMIESNDVHILDLKIIGISGFLRDIIHVCMKVVGDVCSAIDFDFNNAHHMMPITCYLQELIAVTKEGILTTLSFHKHLDNCSSMKSLIKISEQRDLLKPSSLDYQMMQWVLSLVANAMIHAIHIPSIAAALQIMGEDIENERQ